MNKIKEYQEIINSKIKQVRIQGKPDELYNPINYILSLKSKRVRPTLSILSYSLFKEDFNKEEKIQYIKNGTKTLEFYQEIY